MYSRKTIYPEQCKGATVFEGTGILKALQKLGLAEIWNQYCTKQPSSNATTKEKDDDGRNTISRIRLAGLCCKNRK